MPNPRWLFVTAFCTVALAQEPIQIPLPPEPELPITTLKANARAVLLDVVVTDGHGHAVHGLKPGDFHIFEDGKPQTVASLEEHHRPTAEELAKLPPMPLLGPNTWTNRKPPTLDHGGASTVFLLDALDSSPQSQMYARSELLAFVKNMQPGNEVAIFQLDTSLRLIQGFTADPAVLLTAVKERDQPVLTVIPQNGSYSAQAARMDILNAAMQTLGTYLATRPGRKNLVWFTARIPRTVYAGGGALGGSLHDGESFRFDYSKATDALVLGQISVYPIDTRGLQINPAMSAANSRMPGARSNANFGARQYLEHSDLDEVAEATGGRAFYDTNGIKEAVAEVIETGSSFYTLSFYPTNKTWDGSYRALKLDTANTGLQLQYRRGYYAQTEARKARQAAMTAAQEGKGRVQLTHSQPSADQTAFLSAMQLGAVDPAQILLTAHVTSSADVEKMGKSQALPKDNNLEPKYRNQAFRNFSVTVRVDGRQLEFEPSAKGMHKGSLEFLALVFDEKGGVVNSLSSTVEMNLLPETYDRMLRTGVEMPVQIAVPEKGKYFLRVGIHDKTSGKAGALELSSGDVK